MTTEGIPMTARFLGLILLVAVPALGAQTPRPARPPRAEPAPRPERAPRPMRIDDHWLIEPMHLDRPLTHAPMEPHWPMEPLMPLWPSEPLMPLWPSEPIMPLWPTVPLTPMPPMEPLVSLAPAAPLAPLLPRTPEPGEPAPWHFENRLFERGHLAPIVATTPPSLHWSSVDHTWPSGARSFTTTPRASWASDDPADSLYRRARELLNRGEWRLAAQAFRDIPQRFPSSEYAPDALYWQAYALYRIGNLNELRDARSALDSRRTKYGNAKGVSNADVEALNMRIQGALASRGDPNAREVVSRAVQQGGAVCDRDDQMVRIEALGAIYKTDPESAPALVEKVLARQDECSIMLRRNAVMLIGNRRDASATRILSRVARNDSSTDVRTEAIGWLGRMSDDEALSVLEDILRSSEDERVQRAAIRALSTHSNPRAKQRVRTLIERADVSERLRSDAISTFERERPSEEDAAWLRSIYPRLERTSLKQRVVSVVARAGGTENDRWLSTIVNNEDEPSEVRATALGRLGQTMPVPDLARMYDGASSRTVREYLINSLGRRPEAEATDKLIDIVKTGTDPNLRRSAINALTQKKDPRTTKLLLEIIDK
jgi:HEAT repeat protein